MTRHIFNLLIIIIIGTALPGHPEGAWGDPMMVCRDEDPAKKVTWTCKTSAPADNESKVVCHNGGSAPSIHLRYICNINTRDWASPSPYAHVSRIWTCISGNFKKLLFDQDFSDAAMRCNLICGRCSTGWQHAK